MMSHVNGEPSCVYDRPLIGPWGVILRTPLLLLGLVACLNTNHSRFPRHRDVGRRAPSHAWKSSRNPQCPVRTMIWKNGREFGELVSALVIVSLKDILLRLTLRENGSHSQVKSGVLSRSSPLRPGLTPRFVRRFGDKDLGEEVDDRKKT